MTGIRSRCWSLLAAGTVLAAVLSAAPAGAAPPGAPTGSAPKLVRTIGGSGHAPMYPSGLEYSDVDDTLVVADTGNHKIAKFDPVTGEMVWQVGGYGTGVSRFSDPRDVGVGSDGSIYVADTGNSRIVKLNADGSWNTFWKGQTGDTVGSPIGVSVSAVHGQDRVYIADGLKLRVRVWNAALTTQLVSAASNGVCVFSNVRDADADDDGNIYVANYLRNDILKLDADGTCLTRWGTKGVGDGQFKNPYGVRLAVDPEDGMERVYVADSNNDRIQVFAKNGTYIDKFGTAGNYDYSQTGTFSALRRVAVAPDGDLWGADLWGYAIEHVDVTGRHADVGGAYRFDGSIPAVPTQPPFSDTAVFNEVRQIAFDNAGELLAMDSVNQRVVRFDPTTGALIPPACGKRGWENGAFNWPRGVAIDPVSNRIWIADTKQSQLQILEGDCSFVAKMPASTTGGDRFNWPQALAIRGSDGTVWVVDTKNNRIKVYDADSREPILVYGTKGSNAEQFLQPKAISFDPADPTHVLVADTNNNRIVELVAEEHPTGPGDITWLRTRNGFKKPSGVARDAFGRTFVADSMNNRVMVLDPVNWNLTYATIVQQMSKPEQVAVGPDGRLYVSDTYNDRILVYEYTT
jgi:tripartite motif-containing protein 71